MRLLVLVVLVLAVAVFARATLFSSLPSRRARWRIRFRCKPAPGFASFGELAFRWSRLAAVVHGRRVRPDLGFGARLVCPVTWYAWRLGRAQYFKRVFAPQEHQTAIIAPPRVGKSGFLGEWMLSHRGACVSFTTRADLYELTAGTRALLGPVHVFNPYGVGGIPSTFRPDIIAGCLSPEVAVRRAAALIGETSMLGEMVFWSDKAAVALAGLMHAAAVGGYDMAKVYLWANRSGESELAALARHPGASRELFAGPGGDLRRHQGRLLDPDDPAAVAGLARRPRAARHGVRPAGPPGRRRGVRRVPEHAVPDLAGRQLLGGGAAVPADLRPDAPRGEPRRHPDPLPAARPGRVLRRRRGRQHRAAQAGAEARGLRRVRVVHGDRDPLGRPAPRGLRRRRRRGDPGLLRHQGHHAGADRRGHAGRPVRAVRHGPLRAGARPGW